MSTLIDICDAVKATIETAIPTLTADSNDVVVGAQVFRDWDPVPWTEADGLLVDSRTVYVIPLGREFQERGDRATDRNAFPVGVWVVDKFPAEWNYKTETALKNRFIDDAVGWVDELFGVVADNDYAPIAGAFLIDGEVTEVCRRDYLRAHGVFVSEIVLTFAVHETN